MQNIKNKEGGNIKGTRGGEKRISWRRKRSNSTSMMKLWTEKERYEEERGE